MAREKERERERDKEREREREREGERGRKHIGNRHRMIEGVQFRAETHELERDEKVTEENTKTHVIAQSCTFSAKKRAPETHTSKTFLNPFTDWSKTNTAPCLTGSRWTQYLD